MPAENDLPPNNIKPDEPVFDLTPRELAEEFSFARPDEQSSESGSDQHPENFDVDDAGIKLNTADQKNFNDNLTQVDPNGDDGDQSDNDSLANIDGDEPEEPGAMTLVEHLTELRDRLVRCLAYVGSAFALALYLGRYIIEFLQRPAGDMKFQALSIEEPLIVYFKVCFYASLIIASPFILSEVSRFIAPGLTKKERQIVTPALVGGPVLFVMGAAFAYYCLLPTMFHFFNTFGQGIAPIHQRLDFYMSLVASILLYMGLCFQLPIVLFALSFTGLVTSNQLIKIWRYAVFAASLVALVITPDPTAFSMLLVMGALVGLYTISVLLLKLFGR
ncbi:MAG: twin-arginine translocase subunit TatC [Candidatus Melainabacteria bacterium]|nr:twin-arginine translocase subunit TatC [Candidatus Melainabacteria bacterium]